MNIDIQWGGYYASREEGDTEFGVFRLLDFNRDAYQAAIFKEKFAELPNLEDIMKLSPYIGHAPIDSKALLRPKEIYLLGGQQLAEEDLEGYRFYLEHHEVGEKEIEELLGNVIVFSHEPVLKLTLTLSGDELQITER